MLNQMQNVESLFGFGMFWGMQKKLIN